MLKLEMTLHFLSGITFIRHANQTYTRFAFLPSSLKLNADFTLNSDPNFNLSIVK